MLRRCEKSYSLDICVWGEITLSQYYMDHSMVCIWWMSLIKKNPASF